MIIGFSSYNLNSTNTISFNGKVEKLINMLKNTKDFKHARVTCDEAIKIYNKLGYKTRLKAGSHVTVTAPDMFEFSLQLPHNNEKRFIHPNDVKKLHFVLNNDRQGLINSIKI